MWIDRLAALALPVVLLGTVPGCGGGVCADLCEWYVRCELGDDCDNVDEDTLVDACEEACDDGFEYLDTDAEEDVEECLQCYADEGSATCNEGELEDACDAVCDDNGPAEDSVETWADSFENVLDQLLGDECGGDETTAVCGSSSSSGGGSVQCDASCGAVSASCTGTAGAPLSCTCTSGPRAGDDFQATDCSTLIQIVEASCG
jgi:hypothetical protein